MLTIQPNFSQRIHNAQPFGKQSAVIIVPKEKLTIPYLNDKHSASRASDLNTDEFERDIVDAEYEEIFDEEAQSSNLPAVVDREERVNKNDEDLNDIKNNINATMNNLKDVQKELPAGAQKAMNGLFTLGAAAVSGISVKYGFTETNKILGKLFKKPAMKKFGENFVKPFKAGWKAVKGFFKTQYKKFKTTGMYDTITKSFEKFKTTKFGKKLVNMYEKFSKSKPVQETKVFIAKVRDIKPDKVQEATGDILGVATGISAGVAANLEPDKVKETI